MEEINIDFQNYDLQNYIEPAQLIKVVRRINYDLGLRIMKTSEELLDVEKGRVKLPDNFQILNYALICDEHSVEVITPQGTNIQEIPYREIPAQINTCEPPTVNCTKCTPNPCTCNSCGTSCSTSTIEYNPLVPFGNTCNPPRTFMNCKGDCYELIQIVNTVTYKYKRLLPLKLATNAKDIDCGCPNLYMRTNNEAWIRDGYLYTSFQTGKVYINYQSQMEDEEGNLLVPDHDGLNDYYEYELKKRILENLIMNDEMSASAKLQLIEVRARAARNIAYSIVNTPNFSEMKELWKANRKAQYHKYYNMFKSYSWSKDTNPFNYLGEHLL